MAETFHGGHALLIGAGGDLPMTVQDATALHDLLIDPGRGAYPADQVDLRTEEKADRRGILEGLDRLIQRVDAAPDSTALVYFSGHGGRFEPARGRREHFLVPFGFNRAARAETAVSGQEFTDRIEALRARRLVVLLDCCHAGGVPALKEPAEPFVSSPVPPELLARLEEGEGRVVVASSHEDEYSYTLGPRSVFTACLLEALQGAGTAAGDGFARILDVLSFLFREVPRRAPGPQRPFVNKVLGLSDNFPLCYHGRVREPAAGRAPAGGGFTPGREPALEALAGDLLGAAVQGLKERRDRYRDDLQRNVLDFYVEARGAAEPLRGAAGSARGEPLWDLLQESLRAARPVMLLAEFGMGKTWFLEMARYRLAATADPRAVEAGESWIPLLVKLRDFRYERPSGLSGLMSGLLGGGPSTAFEQLREQALVAAFGELALKKHGEALLRMFEEGRFLFLLDALDEISIASRESADAVLTEIGRIGSHVRRSPVVVTCRRSFFQDAAQEASLKDRGFDVYHLWPWSREDFLGYLEKAHQAGVLEQAPEAALARIEAIHDLRDITGRALLSAMVVDQFDEILAQAVVDVPSLYERYIERGILNWQAGKAHLLGSHEIKRFMEELAFLMFSLNSLTISPDELDEYFSGKFREFDVARFSSVAESLVRDVKTNSFLTRADSQFTFCHASLWEFMVARKLAHDLAAGDGSSLRVPDRSAQYRSIHKHFLVPMLAREGRLGLLLNA